MATAGHSRIATSNTKTAYFSLSQIEDSGDTSFLEKIAQSAAVNAINENKALNIPITVAENGWVVRKTATGETIRISKIPQNLDAKSERKLTKGTILHVKPQE